LKKIVIIGGGPAGATAATILSKYFQTILIQDKIWDKPCGGGIKAKIFKELNLPSYLIKHKISHLYIHYKNKNIKIDLKGENLFIVKRKEFDDFLRKNAQKNGAQLIYAKLKDIQGNSIILSNNKKIEFDILIAADGVNSKVRKILKLPPIPKILTYYGITNINVNTCHFYFDKKIAGDYYAWVFPHENKAHIGCVNSNNFKKFQEILNTNIKPKGYYIPTWQENIKTQINNIYFVGDAAGQVMPLSFEGIYYAMQSAKILANTIINNKNYKQEWEKKFLKEFKFMKNLENLMKYNLTREILIYLQQFKFFQNISVNLWLGKYL
jgi:geranylgeranyl reductase